MYRTVPFSRGTLSTSIFLRSVTCLCSVRKCARTFPCYAGIFHTNTFPCWTGTHCTETFQHTAGGLKQHVQERFLAQEEHYQHSLLSKNIMYENVSLLYNVQNSSLLRRNVKYKYFSSLCNISLLSIIVRRKCAKTFPCYAGIFHTNTLPRWTGTHCTGTVPLSVGTSHHVQGYFPAQWEYSPKGKNELIYTRGKWKQGKGSVAKKAVLTMLRDFLVRVSMGSDMRGTVTHSGVLMSPPSRSTSITSNCKPVTTLKMHLPQLLYKIIQL